MNPKAALLLILALSLNLTGICSAEEPNLVGYWPLDETSGHIAYDSSGSGTNGRVVGRIGWVPTEGKFQGAARFDGTETYHIEIPTTGISPTGGTIALWIKLAQPQSGQGRNGYRFLFGCGGNPDRIQLYMNDNDTWLDLGLGNKHRRYEEIVNLNTNLWYHIALTWDGKSYAVYVNGVQEATGSYAGLKQVATEASIGNNGNRSRQAFHGLIDDVTIFDGPLSEEQVAQLYQPKDMELSAQSVLLTLLHQVKKTRTLLKKRQSKEAIAFLDDKISEYEMWSRRNSNSVTPAHKALSYELYMVSAQVKEAAALNPNDIAAAYKLAAQKMMLTRPDSASPLSWLFEQVPADEYSTVVTECVRNDIITGENISYIVRHFKSHGNLTAFRHFLNALSSDVNDFSGYAEAVHDNLKDNKAWGAEFVRYLASKPQLTKGLIRIYKQSAQKYCEQGSFSEAEEAYRNALNYCGDDKKKSLFQFKICECIFQKGEYQQALSHISQFLTRYKALSRKCTEKALLIKAQCYIQSGQPDRALAELLTLLVEYPESTNAPATAFFYGACLTLLDKFEQAIDAFNLVIQNDPQSLYAAKAGAYIARISAVTDTPGALSTSLTGDCDKQAGPNGITAFDKTLQTSDSFNALCIGDSIFQQLGQKYNNNDGFNMLKAKLLAAESLVGQMKSQLAEAKNRLILSLAGEFLGGKTSGKKDKVLSIASAKSFYEKSAEWFLNPIGIDDLTDDEKTFLTQYYDLKLQVLTNEVAQAGQPLIIIKPYFKGTHNYVLVLPFLHIRQKGTFNTDVLPQWMCKLEHLSIFSDACLFHFGLPVQAMVCKKESAKIQQKPFSELEFYRFAANRCKKSHPYVSVHCLQEAFDGIRDSNPDTAVSLAFDIVQSWLDMERFTLTANQAKEIFEAYPNNTQAAKAVWLYYYALLKSKNTYQILAQIDNAIQDDRYKQYKAQLMYIKWGALRQEGNSTAAAVLEYDLLKNHRDNPIIAPILLSCATELLGKGDFNAAYDSLRDLLEQFPHTSAAEQAKSVLQRLEEAKTVQ